MLKISAAGKTRVDCEMRMRDLARQFFGDVEIEFTESEARALTATMDGTIIQWEVDYDITG